MIEIPHFPAVGRVTLTAVLPESAIVNIIPRVASNTLLRCLTESLRGVTLPAADDDVQPGQRGFGLVVVEVDFLPLRHGVALLALLAE